MDSNLFDWMTLRNNTFVLDGLEEMVKDQGAERKALNPKRGVGGGGYRTVNRLKAAYRRANSSTVTSYGGKTPHSAAMRKNPRIPSTHSSSST